jgi:hypothetical protein
MNIYTDPTGVMSLWWQELVILGNPDLMLSVMTLDHYNNDFSGIWRRQKVTISFKGITDVTQ